MLIFLGPSQLLRLAVILQVIDDAFNYVTKISFEKFILNETFVTDAKNYLLENPVNEIEISVDNLKRAVNLLMFFNKSKIILSGFPCGNFNSSFWNSDCFLTIVSQLCVPRQASISKTESTLCKLILLDENNELDSCSKSKIHQEKFKCLSRDRFNDILTRLSNLKFIRFIKKKNPHGIRSEMIQRLKISCLSLNQISFLKEFDIDLKDPLLNVIDEFKEVSESSEEEDSNCNFYI